jgi:hypothetical protein
MFRTWRSVSLQRGVVGGSIPWMAVAAVLWGAKAVQWALRREERVVYRTVLEPGETLEIVHSTESKASRRRSR